MNNKVFKNHENAASSAIGTYLQNVICIGCQKIAYTYIMNPLENWLGDGGCGAFNCSGLKNLIIQDMTSSFLGYYGTIISNNESIGESIGY